MLSSVLQGTGPPTPTLLPTEPARRANVPLWASSGRRLEVLNVPDVRLGSRAQRSRTHSPGQGSHEAHWAHHLGVAVPVHHASRMYRAPTHSAMLMSPCLWGQQRGEWGLARVGWLQQFATRALVSWWPAFVKRKRSARLSGSCSGFETITWSAFPSLPAARAPIDPAYPFCDCQGRLLLPISYPSSPAHPSPPLHLPSSTTICLGPRSS